MLLLRGRDVSRTLFYKIHSPKIRYWQHTHMIRRRRLRKSSTKLRNCNRFSILHFEYRKQMWTGFGPTIMLQTGDTVVWLLASPCTSRGAGFDNFRVDASIASRDVAHFCHEDQMNAASRPIPWQTTWSEYNNRETTAASVLLALASWLREIL